MNSQLTDPSVYHRQYGNRSNEAREHTPTFIRWRNYSAFFVVAIYLLLNWGAQQLRVPPVGGGGLPLAELFLVMFLATVDPVATLMRFGREVWLLPFLIWWGLGVGRALYDSGSAGLWAIRDASHVIESLFVLVGFVATARPRTLELFFSLLPKFLIVACAYGVLYPVRDVVATFSPTIISFNGLVVPLVGIMANTQYLMIVSAFYVLLFRARTLTNALLIAALIGYPIILFQQRTLYLIMAALTITMIYFRRSSIWSFLVIAMLGLFGLTLISLTGAQFEGRLGAHASPEFILHHLLAIFGICNTDLPGICAAAAGVDQRLGWWSNIFEQLMSSPANLFFGLGYGVVLTDHAGLLGVTTREPHNSYISVVARIGLVGLLAFVALTVAMVRQWFVAYALCTQRGWKEGQHRLLILLVYFICMWVLAIGEDGFEKPYNCVPFYFLWGVVLQMGQLLRDGAIGPAVAAEGTHQERSSRYMASNTHQISNATRRYI